MAKLSKLCRMKYMQSLIAHYSVILANDQDFLSKSNNSGLKKNKFGSGNPTLPNFSGES